MEEDLAGQLRRQIAQATHEKEQAKLDLEGLKRTVDSHLLRLNSVLGSADVSFDRFSSAIQSFDADLRGKLDVDTGPRDGYQAEGTYEVLRHSLNEAQKRCQVLNSDMLRVADANEELMGTLKTLKGTNKRLAEEVQKHSEELSTLTQQRLLDAENLQRLEDAFRQDQAMWQQESQRCIDDEHERCQEDFGKLRDQLNDQVDSCCARAKDIASKAGGIRSQQGQLKTEVVSFAQTVGMSMKKLERDIVEKIASKTRQMEEDHSKLRDIEHNLQVKLRAEKEVRENETEAWRNRHQSLTRELDGLIDRRDREVSDVQAKVQSINDARDTETKAMREDRKVLHDKIEGAVKEVALLDAKMQTARRKGLQLEAHLAQAEGERDRLQETAETLRRQIRESDEALGEAVRSNEALREQMEVQRLEAHNANERDLKTCREYFEKQLEDAQHIYAAEQSDLAKKIRHMEEQVGLKAGELQMMRESLNEMTRKRDSTQRDVLLWKAQHELSAKTKGDVERELTQFRSENINGELRRMQDEHDELSEKKEELEGKRQAVFEEVQEAQRTVKARELHHQDRSSAIRDAHAEASVEAERVKAQLSEAESGLARAKAESASFGQQSREKREKLEQDISRVTSELEQEKRDYERKIQAERLKAEGLRDSFERLRNEHRTSYKAAFDGPVQQISALESAISEIQRNSDAELAGLKQKSEKLRSRVDTLETELAQVQAKLQQTEQEVQEGTARVNLAKANHRASREAMEREKKQKTEEMHQVQRSIAQKSEALKSITRAGEDVRKKMLRDIEDAKMAKTKQLADSDRRIHALRPSADPSPFALEDNRHAPSPDLTRENESLRMNLASMEGRSERLRRELPDRRR